MEGICIKYWNLYHNTLVKYHMSFNSLLNSSHIGDYMHINIEGYYMKCI